MEDGRDNRVYEEEDGRRYLLDENGNFVKDERGNRMPSSQARKISKPGEWTEYDTSQGHCGLCGSLTCRGNCFK